MLSFIYFHEHELVLTANNIPFSPTVPLIIEYVDRVYK
ncbi:hypothetical protein J2T18_001088 [Paenibacillus polymyxa]|nr:hypothetical protein [Paenibacillus polymyxa]